MMSIICGEFKLDDMWDLTSAICEKPHGNLWGFLQEIFVGVQYHGEYLSNVWEIFMWAQNDVWAHVVIFCEWTNEIKTRKFVPQQHLCYFERVIIDHWINYKCLDN